MSPSFPLEPALTFLERYDNLNTLLRLMPSSCDPFGQFQNGSAHIPAGRERRIRGHQAQRLYLVGDRLQRCQPDPHHPT